MCTILAEIKKMIGIGHVARPFLVLFLGLFLSLSGTSLFSEQLNETREEKIRVESVKVEKGVFYYDNTVVDKEDVTDDVDNGDDKNNDNNDDINDNDYVSVIVEEEVYHGGQAGENDADLASSSPYSSDSSEISDGNDVIDKTDLFGTFGWTGTLGNTGAIAEMNSFGPIAANSEEDVFLAQSRPSRLLNNLSNRTRRTEMLGPLKTPLSTFIEPLQSSQSPSVRTTYIQLYDAERRRTVPIKMYLPNPLLPGTPVIIFSHGLGGSRESCPYFGEHWASNGFVVVAVQHIGSDETVWRGHLRPVNELRAAFERNWTCATRVSDILFVLTQLTVLAEKPDSVVESQVDLTRVGVAGYDMGAYTALLLAGQLAPEGFPPIQDSRIKAILAMSPPVPSTSARLSEIYANIEVPCLFITGTEDDGIIGTTRAFQRRIPFDQILQNDQYLLTFFGTDHYLYAGNMLLPSIKNNAVYYNAMEKLSCVFWNAYLRSDLKSLEYIMSKNILGLTKGLGRLERKFYQRPESPQSDTLNDLDKQERTNTIVPPHNPKVDLSNVYTLPVRPYGAPTTDTLSPADQINAAPQKALTPVPPIRNLKLVPQPLPTSSSTHP
ncbi:MAG: alpha/beta hydrolase family protein [Thermoguttaceae bacterium]